MDETILDPAGFPLAQAGHPSTTVGPETFPDALTPPFLDFSLPGGRGKTQPLRLGPVHVCLNCRPADEMVVIAGRARQRGSHKPQKGARRGGGALRVRDSRSGHTTAGAAAPEATLPGRDNPHWETGNHKPSSSFRASFPRRHTALLDDAMVGLTRRPCRLFQRTPYGDGVSSNPRPTEDGVTGSHRSHIECLGGRLPILPSSSSPRVHLCLWGSSATSHPAIHRDRLALPSTTPVQGPADAGDRPSP